MGNILSLFTGSPERPQIIRDPEVVHAVDFKRIPALLRIVPNLEAASEVNPGVDDPMVPNSVVPIRPEVVVENLLQRQQLRDEVQGNNILAPELKNDTTQADWDESLTQMQHEKELDELAELRRQKEAERLERERLIEESRRRVNEEAA